MPILVNALGLRCVQSASAEVAAQIGTQSMEARVGPHSHDELGGGESASTVGACIASCIR